MCPGGEKNNEEREETHEWRLLVRFVVSDGRRGERIDFLSLCLCGKREDTRDVLGDVGKGWSSGYL